MQLPFLLDTKSRSASFSPASFIACMTIQDLRGFIPENSTGYILDWFQFHPVQFRISKARSSKFGDYRAPVKNLPARISVNRNLNRFDFLITLVHEMAHHEVWTETSLPILGAGIHGRKRRPRPHGKEWKTQYQQLMSPLMEESVFPAEVVHHLARYFENPRSSSKSNEHLVVALKKYDAPDDSVFIESLPLNAVFSLPAGKKFRKQEKLRKRYRCVCLANGRIYLFSPMARVMPVPC
jgi:predicted SprT family Zn-dependent metalloprotease